MKNKTCQQAREKLVTVKAYTKWLKNSLVDPTQSRKFELSYDIHNSLENKIAELEKAITPSIEDAREIFDSEKQKNVFGPEEVRQTFGIELKPEEIPPIQFSFAELRWAAEHHQALMLVVDRTDDGPPMTAQEINNQYLYGVDIDKRVSASRIHDDPTKHDISRLLINGFDQQTPLEAIKSDRRAQWVLITTKSHAYFRIRDFLNQTEMIKIILKQQLAIIKNSERRQLIQKAIGELSYRIGELRYEVRHLRKNRFQADNNSITKLARALTSLRINRYFRPNLALMTYLLLLYREINQINLLPNSNYVNINNYNQASNSLNSGAIISIGADLRLISMDIEGKNPDTGTFYFRAF